MNPIKSFVWNSNKYNTLLQSEVEESNNDSAFSVAIKLEQADKVHLQLQNDIINNNSKD